MAAVYGPRPSFESSRSYGAQGIDDEVAKMDDEGETVDSVMNKLAIERRVQYGAEKMLDVIEQRGGGGDGGEQDQVKDRITAQLEAANERIKELEATLERLRGGTPQRPRRRPQPKLNGYASTSSLGQSLGSSSFLSSRPRPSRQGSTLTPDREREYFDSPAAAAAAAAAAAGPSGQGTPSRHGGSPSLFSTSGRARSRSTGGESDVTSSDGPTRFDSSRSRSGLSSPGEMMLHVEDENTMVLLEAVTSTLRRLRELAMPVQGKGKRRDTEPGDEVWGCLNRLADTLKKSDGLKALLNAEEVVQCVLPFLADEATSRRRAAAYRALRYLLDRDTWGKMLLAGLEWIVIRTFARDAKAVHEREQALRLLRAVTTLPPPTRSHRTASLRYHTSPARSRPTQSRHGSAKAALPGHVAQLLACRVPLTDGLVRAVVSAAENPDDAMRIVCMETLVEIGILDLGRLVQSDAFRTVLLAFKDGPTELGPAMTGMLLYLTNQPSTRHLLIPGSDLETVLVGLTEEYGKVSQRQMGKHMDKLQWSVRNVSMLLGSWPGLLYLCMDDCRAIKSLISSLHIPVTEMRDAILDLFFSCLRIKAPPFMNAFLEGKRLTMYNRTQEAMSQQLQEEVDEDDNLQPLNLVDHFIALLLAIFIESGLLEALVAIIQENSGALNRKATLLLGELLQMANRILPLRFAAQLQALPRLFLGATEFSNANDRHQALSALSSIDSLNRNQTRANKQQGRRDRSGSNAAHDPLQRGQRQVQSVKLRLGLQVEDKQFQQMIVDTGVLLGRDHTKWNYDLIVDLVEGPLLNSKRLEETIKATKFIRRLFSFYHPLNNRFSSIKRTRPNHKWVKLACSLLSTMLVSPEGIKFISEDKLFPQLSDCFFEIEHQPLASYAVLAPDRLENSLSYGYFEMLGVLSKHREGIKLLEKFKFFNSFYHLSEQRSREDITRMAIECFDYSINSHPRIILSKALTSAFQETRLFATHHLARLLHDAPSLLDWSLQLMITQLYDVAMEVCDVAVMYLEEVCSDTECLEKVVQMRPTLEHLGDVGHPLFMRFVSTSIGFRYLFQAQYIDRELESWMTERNLLYVIEAETFVSRTVRPFMNDQVEDYWQYDSMAPTHFFGELTKTSEGCMYLKEKGIVPEFAEIVRLHGMEENDQAILTNVKSVLWALGNIGSTEGGLPFLEDEEIVEIIVEIAEQSPVLIMKGTCFFVLGLISSTRMGAELLEELGWVSTRTPMGHTTGICLPNDISRFVQIEPWERMEMPLSTPPLPKLTGLEGEIMNSIANLSNYVLAAGAMNNLKRIRTRHPRYFSSITLFHRALRIISTNHYQAPVRRFILDLFDVQLEPETLLRLGHIEVASHEAKPEESGNGNGNGNGNGSESEIAEVRFAPVRKGLLGLDNFGFETNRDMVYRNPPRRGDYRDVEHEHDHESETREREHRRRSASSPGPGPPEVSVSVSPAPLGQATKARTRGLTISELRPRPRGGVGSAGFRGGSGEIRPDGLGKAHGYEVGEVGEVQQVGGEGGRGGGRVEGEDGDGDGDGDGDEDEDDQDQPTARVPVPVSVPVAVAVAAVRRSEADQNDD